MVHYVVLPACLVMKAESCTLWPSPKDDSNTQGLTREDPKYPLTQLVRRALRSLARWFPCLRRRDPLAHSIRAFPSPFD